MDREQRETDDARKERVQRTRVLADNARALFERKRGEGASLRYTDGLRVAEVKEPPQAIERVPGAEQPGLRMILDVTQDGKSILPPGANPFYFVGIPDELDGETDPEAIIGKLVRMTIPRGRR